MLLLSIHHDAARNKRAQPLHSLTLDGCEATSTPVRTKVSRREIRPAFASRYDSVRRPPTSESEVKHHDDETSTGTKRSSALPQHVIAETSSSNGSSLSVAKNHHHHRHHTTSSMPLTRISDQALAKPLLQRNASKQTAQVTFSKIHIREHSITVGDHDWCEGSLPIQLDWQHTPTHSMDVDDYEWHRQRQGRTPRGRLPKLDPSQRKRLLRRVAGITEEDLFLLERQHIDSKYVTQHCSKTKTFYVSQ